MHRSLLRRGVIVAASLLAAAGLAAPARAASAGTSLSGLTDPTGDVVDNDAGTALAEPRADITAASAEYRKAMIFLRLNVVQPTNIATDPNWDDGSSGVMWVLDTTGDDEAEFLVTLERGRSTVVSVDNPGTPLCVGQGGLDGSAHTAAVDSQCVGDPASFKWGAVMVYDTNRVDANAPVGIDVIPNGDAMAGPVSRPLGSGYWMITDNGQVFSFGDAKHLGNEIATTVKRVDIEPTPSGNGYWILAESGAVHAKGDAKWLGSALTSLQPGEKAAALSANSTGDGYWIFTDRGRVLAFGTAQHFGDMSGVPLNGAVLDSVATPSGQGYWMVASDGGVFTFGDARFSGSTGNMKLNKPVMSMAADPDGAGYWLVASDGGIFAFDAPFYGSTGHLKLNRPVSGIVPGSAGYLMVAEDGGIFSFGDVAFHGSLGANPPAQPVVAVALLD